MLKHARHSAHALFTRACVSTCFEHSVLLKVNGLVLWFQGKGEGFLFLKKEFPKTKKTSTNPFPPIPVFPFSGLFIAEVHPEMGEKTPTQ
jgi:hypothetical protein